MRSNRDLRKLTIPLITLVAINVIPGFYLRPLWSTALCLIFLGYRFFVEVTNTKVPPRWVVFIAQGAIATAIWQHYNSIFGDEAAGTLLTLLACLKTYELRFKRDYFVCSLLCFMVLMSNLLLDQSLLLTLYVVADVVLIVSFLYALEGETFDWKSYRGYLKPTFLLTLKSIPLLVICFVLFPRFSTGFGTGNQPTGQTGLPDELSPGTVSKLIQSDELVFRATFMDGEMPPKPTLYWRGAVLDQSNGLNWTREQTVDRRPLPYASGEGNVEIFLEPGFERYLFSLESTRSVDFPSDFARRRVNWREGEIFELNVPLQNRERYILHNSPDKVLNEENIDSTRYLKTEQAPSAQMKKLMRQLRANNQSSIVGNILTLFRGNGFQYSMEPPTVDGIDEFIFNTKLGFCEHYAASMATILRWMGVPSRVVVGFQGGAQSFLDNYITVRGLDAHAWVEYYSSADKRWRRVDPTAQVAPARLTLGSESYMTDAQSWLPKWLMDSNATYRRVRAMVDEVEASWIGFLLRFDLARQKELLAKFGMEETLYRALPVFLLLGLALVAALLYFFEAQRREPLPLEDRLYRDLTKALAKWNIDPTPADGPLNLMEKVRARHPQLTDKVAPPLERLVLARFGGRELTAQEARIVAQQVRRLKKLSIKDATH